MPVTSDEQPQFDLETSLYGPGSLACWYLTLLCVCISWTTHPTKHFLQLSLSADVVFFAFYACLAAGHMVILSGHFQESDGGVAALERFLGHSAGLISPKFPESYSPALRKMIAGINAPFRVAVSFLWLVGFCLVVIGRMPPHMRAEPRRRSFLLWVLLVSEFGVLGCLCVLSARCGLGTVLLGMLWCTIDIVLGHLKILLAISLSLNFLSVVLICVLSVIVLAWGTYYACRMVLCVGLAMCCQCFGLSQRRPKASSKGGVSLYWCALLSPNYLFLLWGGNALIMGIETLGECWRLAIVAFFPDVGVKISAIDQILGLCTGMVSLIFTIYNAYRKRGARTGARVATFWGAKVKRFLPWPWKRQAGGGFSNQLAELPR